jgi:glycerol-3-phosphate O-acyltransferase/dihydroxyacetone phosphate acyltransferase
LIFKFSLLLLLLTPLSPVKIICSTIAIDTKWLLACFIIGFIGVVSANAKELVYFSLKVIVLCSSMCLCFYFLRCLCLSCYFQVFFHSVLSTFFSSMEVLGRENIPEHGPIIFTGNHMNQFVDGGVMMVTTPQRVGLLVAEKSFHKRIIGDFARALGSIPVSRPQDEAKKGPGTLSFDGVKLRGKETKFTELKKGNFCGAQIFLHLPHPSSNFDHFASFPLLYSSFFMRRLGDRLRPGKSPESYRVKEVLNDTEAVLAVDYGEASPLDEHIAQGKWTTYDILKHIDQSEMFDSVQRALANGQCLGIFPEGGSHDRTDLLPLKVCPRPFSLLLVLSLSLSLSLSLALSLCFPPLYSICRLVLLRSLWERKRNTVSMFLLFPLG